jgi:HEAT repeat protein
MLFSTPQLPRTLGAALRDSEHADPAIRRSATVDLGRLYGSLDGDDEARDRVETALLRLLGDDAPEVRGEAAEQAGTARIVAALPKLLAAVEDAHVVVRQMAIAALGDLGDARAIGRLTRALADERPELRYQAAMALPRISPENAEGFLLRALEDTDADVRHIALRTAEETYSPALAGPEKPVPELPTALITRSTALLDDVALPVRIAAALLLASVGNRRGKDLLLEVVAGAPATKGIEPDDEGAAVEAVGALQLKAAIPALRRRAFGVTRLVREQFSFLALVSLVRLGDRQAIERVLADFGAWSRERRTLAVIAAGRGRLLEAEAPLRALLSAAKSGKGAVDRQLLEDALAELAREGSRDEDRHSEA